MLQSIPGAVKNFPGEPGSRPKYKTHVNKVRDFVNSQFR